MMEDVELSMPIVVQPANPSPNSVKWKGSARELTMKLFLETSVRLVELQVWVVQTCLPPNTSAKKNDSNTATRRYRAGLYNVSRGE
jgi:hypothetical protein